MVLTKSMLLGLILSQNDPMGLICPITIITISSGSYLDWDEALPKDLNEMWTGIVLMLVALTEPSL